MAQQRFVSTNGIRMHIREQGAGPLVLLCHGWPECAYSWRHQLQALAEAGYHAVAPDQRGYGQTDRPEAVDQYTLFHLVGDLVGLMHTLGERTAALVGHDWGAIVAWHAALLRPDIFRSVACLSVPFLPRGPIPPTEGLRRIFGERFFYQLYFQQIGVPEAELERDVRASLRRVLYSASANSVSDRAAPSATDTAKGLLELMKESAELPGWLSEADLDVYTDTFQQSGFRGGLNWYRNMDRNWQLLGAHVGTVIAPPALFIGGRLDPVLDFPGVRPAVERMNEWVPRLRPLLMLDNCGHWIQQEQPERTSAALIDFLRTS